MSQPDHSPAECRDFTVFLVEGGIHHEGRSPIKAFTTRTNADDFRMACEAYILSQPEFPEGDNDEEYAAYRESIEKWREAHPAETDIYDFYAVVELKVVNCPPF